MKITEHTHGDMLTLSIDFGSMNGRMNATLSGHARYAIIDGLLWWAMNRKVDALVAACMPLPIHASMEYAYALQVGESLVSELTLSRFECSSDEQALEGMAYIKGRLDHLAPLAELGPDHQREYRELVALTTLLRERIQHPGAAYHGLDDIMDIPVTKAA